MNNLLYKHDTDFVRDNMLINYCLNNDETLLIESFVRNNGLKLRFRIDEFYFFVTGIHKKYMPSHTPDTFKSGVQRTLHFYELSTQVLQENGYDGNAFLIKVDNSKQIGLLFSAVGDPKCTPLQMAQNLYHLYMEDSTGNPNVRHASTSFVGPYSGYEQIHQAFLDARKLNDLIFFSVRNRVITKEFVEKTARPCDISAIMANTRKLLHITCTGTCAQALRQAEYLVDELVRPSYSMHNYEMLHAFCADSRSMFNTVYSDYIHLPDTKSDDFLYLDDYKAVLSHAIQQYFSGIENQKRYSPTILMALSFINRNYTTDLSLTQLSEYVYANPSSLSSEFNAEVGMSLSEYVTALRTRRAQQLLAETQATIPEIAEQTGFSSAKYFREIFKRQTGLSPQQYRNEHTKKHPT